MRSFLNSFFEGFLIAVPYLLTLFVLLHTYMAITAPNIALALFNAFAACVNGSILYYFQTRKHI